LLTDPSDPGFDFATLYDSLGDNTLRLALRLEASGYVPLAKRMTIVSTLSGATLQPPGSTFANELYRLGGNNFVRGFDDEQFLGTSMIRMVLEWRYLLATNSFFRVFADAGVIADGSDPLSTTESWPLGVGVGLAMETKAGVFGVNYALGRLLDQSEGFRFRNAKIHFGYLTYF
jgi:hemolysin activation/secretion protein